jgi:hypothetical protein
MGLLPSGSGHPVKWQNPVINQAILNPMKFKTTYRFIVCLILVFGFLPTVQAVTDEDLDD